MRAEDLPEIRKLSLFSSMREDTFSTLMKTAYFQTFPAQMQLVSEGDAADFLFVVVEGAVELYSGWNGREAIMAMVRPVSTFILAAVIKDAAYLMSARTSAKSKVLMIPAEDVREAFSSDEVFSRSIVLELANCYRVIVKDHKNHKLRTGVERLANRLLRYHTDQGENGSVVLPHDKRTLASLLGMTPENLSRAFSTLKPYGVKVDGSNVHLTDLPGLETLAKPSHLIDDRKT